jgi:hypothetical protein
MSDGGREQWAAVLDLGRRQGGLTYAQLNDLLPEPDALDELLRLLEEEGVELRDEPPVHDERGWLACSDPGSMLPLVQRIASPRKARLLGVARCRRLWAFYRDPRSRRAVEAAERLADGDATEEERRQALADAEAALAELRQRDGLSTSKEFWFLSAPERAATHLLADDPAAVVGCGSDVAWCLDFFGHPAAGALLATKERDEVALLRELFGNPFRPLTIGPSLLTWNGGIIVSLAQAAYDERQLPEGTLDPARLAVLADALEEAGAGPEIVEHLRGPGPHYQGCVGLDAVVGRS